MKLFSVLTLITVSLCGGLCCGTDHENDTDSFYIENNSIISIENSTDSYNLNDTIYINTNISNEQTTSDNLTIFLNDYIDFNGENVSLLFNLILFKETEYGTLTKIPLNYDNLDIINGSITINEEWIYVENIFDDSTFSSKFGIKLLETGTYYLAGSNLNYNNNGIVYINGGDYEKGYITISSIIVDSIDNNAFKFIVN